MVPRNRGKKKGGAGSIKSIRRAIESSREEIRVFHKRGRDLFKWIEGKMYWESRTNKT